MIILKLSKSDARLMLQEFKEVSSRSVGSVKATPFSLPCEKSSMISSDGKENFVLLLKTGLENASG